MTGMMLRVKISIPEQYASVDEQMRAIDGEVSRMMSETAPEHAATWRIVRWSNPFQGACDLDIEIMKVFPVPDGPEVPGGKKKWDPWWNPWSPPDPVTCNNGGVDPHVKYVNHDWDDPEMPRF